MMIRRSLGRDAKPTCVHVCGRNLERILFLLAQVFVGRSPHHRTAKGVRMSLEAVYDNEVFQVMAVV